MVASSAMLDVDRSAIRKLNLATFTGDAWSVVGTAALPPVAVPRLIADGTPVRWVAYGMTSDSDDAAQEVDTTTEITTCMVKISRTPGAEPLVTPLGATSGAIVGLSVTESDVTSKDVFALAISTIVVGTAPWLWIAPTSGYSLAPTGAAP